MTDLVGKRVRYNSLLSPDESAYRNIKGLVTEQYDNSGWWFVEWDNGPLTIDNEEWFDIIEDNMENTKAFLGEEAVVNGKKGLVLEENGDTLYVEFEDDADYFLKSQVSLLVGTECQEDAPFDEVVQNSLINLQKLCTTNNIHILISNESSGGSYQIWDEHSDDTYEMNNVDDVMKAIECLNELKKWRQ